MTMPSQFTHEEAALMADRNFFLAKVQIMAKVRRLLTATHAALKEEVAAAALVTPPNFNSANCQFVKGEALECFPYQYLDFPKHFHDSNVFAFRTLFWWGHHVVCALMLEGEGIKPHKARIVDRFHQLAGQGLELSLAPTLWEWKRGEGYTLPITHDRKAQIAAVLAERSFVKIVRFLPFSDPRIQSGQMPEFSRETFRAILPIVTR
ncbi:MAG: hypothetical protein ABIO96_11240 [Nitrospiraceae bacterium]